MIITAILSLILWMGAQIQDIPENFKNPPRELANHVIWGWEGEMSLETIRHDLDSIKSKGFHSLIIEAGYHLPYEYLSEGWFKAIRTAVLEAKARDMKVWIIDEGKYPSGFAGGKFTRERPDLRMKALVVADTVKAPHGTVIQNMEVPSNVLSAVAVSRSAQQDRAVEVKEGRLSFTAGKEDWDILLVGWDYRTGDTRAVNNPTGGKDRKNSQSDYLSPEAVRQFIDWTHEQYKKYIGDEFGKTVLGFRGDEPDFSYLPWTPDMTAQFMARKGYDPSPYLGTLLGRRPSLEARLFRADYWDVWSDLFAVNFFKQQADWCEENGLSYITHLNKDHDMPSCVRVSGDFFRDLSKIQVPGVDAIWNQIWPETVNDFPKFASSVAHVYGKRRAFSESFAAYNIPPTIPTAKYAVDYQMVRGINFFEFMFWMAGSKNRNWMTDPGMKALNDYTGRVTYMLGLGKPGARIAVYYPTSTLWLGNSSHNQDLVNISQLLLTHQRDFDWVSDDAFSEALTVRSTCLENKSGQKYHTLIIPSAEAVSEAAWAKMEEFAKRGGKVLFWGRRPSMLYGKSFFENKPFPLSGKNMFEEAAVAWTPTVVAALPQPELSLEGVAPKVSYTRRHLEGGEIYFMTNEGEEPYEFTAVFDGSGTVREWNGYDGSSKVLDGEKDGPRTKIHMTLNPWESRLISIERQNTEYNVRKYGVKGNGKSETQAIQAVIDRAYASGGGTVVFPAGNYLSGALFFPSGVNLRVEKNAVLKGSADPSEYPMIPTRFEGTDKEWRCAFLNFDNSPGVSVSGKGTIDGNGLEWKKLPYDGGRPRLICLTACDGGRVSGLKFRNQACWCLHLLYTQGFEIEGLNIEAKEYIPSSDGIDIDSSSDVRIADCYISVHDDCISIKSGKDAEGRRVGRPSEDILIENCHFGYGHGAITMGSEISGDIRNVTARNCRVDEDNWAPIRFKSQPSRGGTVENITFENIEVSHVRNIFDVNLEWRPGSDRNRVIAYSDPVTQLRNITVRNVHGDGRTMGHINGFASDPIGKDVFHFENCRFHTETGLSLRNAAVNMNGLECTVDKGGKMLSGPAAQAAEIIERVFNYLDGCTPYQLVNAAGKEVKASDLDAGTSFKRGSFGINTYEWGVTYSGLLLAAEVLSEDKYLDYVYDRLNALGQAYDKVKKIYAVTPQCRLALMEAPRFLDDCGSMCAAMSKATLKDPVRAKDFRNVLERWFQFCMYEEYRLSDGILARHRPAENSIWLDDMYMGITPIAFRGTLAAAENEAAAEKYFQEAIQQVRLFGKYLWIPEKNLYRHGWIEGVSEHPDYHWARCNGWAMLTMCDVLDAVPEGTPGREEVLEQLKKHIQGVAEWQASDGRWHQLLNKDESYLETSATAIFVYCIAHAVNEGWIDKTAYKDVARSGWSGLVSQINEQGQVENTCVGTGLGWTNTFYANRPVSVLAAHGYGPVLLAAAEIIKLQNSSTK